jgi:predicted tellurium resistance membrane protein TerC
MEISIISVITLIILEIILSIDNLIFVVTISERMSGRFKEPVKFFGLTIALFLRVVFLVRVVGLSMAFLMRGAFVFSVDSIFKMKTTFFKIGSQDITYKELIFILGGLLLIYKSGMEGKRIILCEDEIEKQTIQAKLKLKKKKKKSQKDRKSVV